MGGRNRTPDCRMDCSSAHGGMWLGAGSTVPHPRSRSHLWRDRHPAPLGAADQRSTDIAALAVAKSLCRTAGRLGAPGVRRPRRRAWRTAPASRAPVVHEVLQRDAHALVTEQGRTDAARCPGRWSHPLPADLGRTASSIWPDLIYDTHSPSAWLPPCPYLSVESLNAPRLPPNAGRSFSGIRRRYS